MRAGLILISTVCWSAIIACADEPFPTVRILPADVVQSSIEQCPSAVQTNKLAISWQYTDAGARKMLAFRRAHAGGMFVEQVGDFQFQGRMLKIRSEGEEGWLKSRRDKLSAVSVDDAKKIVAGLKAK